MTTINRAPFNLLVDDPGDNLTGTIWGKDDIKAVLLDPIDVALAAIAEVTPWTPVDSSGAGLAFSGAAGTQVKIGRWVVANLNITFPANANGAAITIGGLSLYAPNVPPYWGGFVSYTTCNIPMTITVANLVINAYNWGGGALANSQLSGHTLRLIVIYPAP